MGPRSVARLWRARAPDESSAPLAAVESARRKAGEKKRREEEAKTAGGAEWIGNHFPGSGWLLLVFIIF